MYTLPVGSVGLCHQLDSSTPIVAADTGGLVSLLMDETVKGTSTVVWTAWLHL